MTAACAPDSTPERLVVAARDLLLEAGLPGLSMRRVAAACGLSATAIYRHFADKDALVAAAVMQGFRTFGAYLHGALDRTTPRARFRQLGARYFDFAREHPQDYRLIFLTDCKQLNLPQLDETQQREVAGTFQMLVDRVTECQETRLFRKGDPRALSAYVWASVHGLASLLIDGRLGADLGELELLCKQQLDLLEISLRA